jgi:hypothetical protein
MEEAEAEAEEEAECLSEVELSELLLELLELLDLLELLLEVYQGVVVSPALFHLRQDL